MKRLGAAAAMVAAGLSLAAGSQAKAEMHTVSTSGFWTAERGTAVDTGLPMCSAKTEGPDYALYVKFVSHKMFFHIGRKGWQLPIGQDIPVGMWVDRAEGWKMNMTALRNAPDSMSGVISTADRTPGEPWFIYVMDLMINGNTLHVVFPEGNTQDWTLNLYGSAPVLRQFLGCVIELDRGQPANGVGQPYGNGNIGQPYGNPAPRPAQPTGVSPKYYYEG